uniref:Uncharacterized protein n=1 Tax=Arundo donax TaxID=35708 RepID=A0A0A8YC15_ARUDO
MRFLHNTSNRPNASKALSDHDLFMGTFRLIHHIGGHRRVVSNGCGCV